jgi:Flp pilus assembly pilin Flp
MSSKFRARLAKFFSDESAPSAIEYAMLVAGVGVIIIAVVYMLGGGARSALEQATPLSPSTTNSPSSPTGP